MNAQSPVATAQLGKRCRDAERSMFVLVAGEASGDLLGEELIASLRARYPGARFAGIGGPRMRAAGMDVWYPAETLSVMGLVETLPHLPRLLAIRRNVFRRTLRDRPAAFVGIDAPDFNLGLERRLKLAGIRSVHYVSPSVWAWREKRVDRIGQSADRVLCLFPMEPPIYARHGVNAQFVGHPLARAFDLEPDKAAARERLRLPANARVLALLPGSRLGEIRRLGGAFLDAAVRLKREFPDLVVVAAMAGERCHDAFARQLAAMPSDAAVSVHLLNGQAHTAMIAADAVLLASGTAALEAMLAKRPMVVAYRLAALTHWLVRRLGLLRTRVYSLPNILAGEALVPERMQADCTPAALADALAPMLRERELPATLHDRFRQLHLALRGEPEHDAGAAVAELLEADAHAPPRESPA